MFHLTARVAWHDSRWNGTVCKAPSCNPYCVALDRVREERNDALEDSLSGRSWDTLEANQLPPCRAESGGFMNEEEWIRVSEHPYAAIDKTLKTHGHLKPTSIKVAPYSTFAVPFNWMLLKNQKAIDASLPEPLPQDEKSPLNTAWVFGRARQEALNTLFFGRLTPERSLVFFYCKEGQPLGDTLSKLIVGVGRITKIHPMMRFKAQGTKDAYPMWDRLFRHSIRPDKDDGFLFPYHDYLEPTGDLEEDARRLELLREIAITPDSAHMTTFSYAAELASPDIALSTLVRCLQSVRKIREHGIAKGPWAKREEWLNAQIALAWQDRGAFPGLGPALEALGMRLGTALALELLSSGEVSPDADPWPVVDKIIRGKKKPPQPAYAADLQAVRNNWTNLENERRNLLLLLSRFAMTVAQMKRCYEPIERDKAFSSPVLDEEILANPYRISEADLGDWNDSPVSVGMVDRGLLPDNTLAAKHPVPEPSCVGSPNDPRRLRAAIVSVLRHAALNGDALLSIPETLQQVAALDLTQSCLLQSDWPINNKSVLDGVVEIVEIAGGDEGKQNLASLQLTELKQREDKLRKILSARASKPIPAPNVDWAKLLKQAIADAGGAFYPANPRHAQAISEQVNALESLTCRRLSVLVGRAGTGKTSVMGALTLCEPINKNGILFLAPTGKARVRLGAATNAEGMTVAQFLSRLGRYDYKRQRPLFTGEEKYRKEKTVVIDECSMLTMDDLAAVLEALDQAHVERLILVGDPNQLPPIGVGRPFADLAIFLETSGDQKLHGALARLSVEVRAAVSNEASDTLRLASWFTREYQPVDADRVLSDLELGNSFNDLEIVFWKTSEELREALLNAFQKHLKLAGPNDIAGFDKSLGLNDKGWVPFEDPSGSEQWQVLSPVRMQSHGVTDLNRWIQHKFRAKQLDNVMNRRGTSLGDEHIVLKDKVIQNRNEWREAYDGSANDKYYIANGEVGLVATGQSGFLNVLFAGRPNLRFGYSSHNFKEGVGPLDLAYALTVHKSQGSEFKKVFVVIPKNCRLLSRELLYTALTRSRQQLVLLLEGDNASLLFDLTRPEKSEVSRRNTNLFHGVVRRSNVEVPYAEHLIHRAEKGHLVRSKSELVIANLLYAHNIQYDYERLYEGTSEPGLLRPDFSFVTPAGDTVVWEHLGMMDREDYRRGWEWKRQWYLKNGLVEGETLFTSEESKEQGLDTAVLKAIVFKIREELD